MGAKCLKLSVLVVKGLGWEERALKTREGACLHAGRKLDPGGLAQSKTENPRSVVLGLPQSGRARGRPVMANRRRKSVDCMSTWGRAGRGPDNFGRTERNLVVLRSQKLLP